MHAKSFKVQNLLALTLFSCFGSFLLLHCFPLSGTLSHISLAIWQCKCNECSSSSAFVSVSSASWVCICTTVPRQIACFCEEYCYDVSLSSKSCTFPQEKALISSSSAAVMLGLALDEHF
jgi:hypothetical protein